MEWKHHYLLTTKDGVDDPEVFKGTYLTAWPSHAEYFSLQSSSDVRDILFQNIIGDRKEWRWKLCLHREQCWSFRATIHIMHREGFRWGMLQGKRIQRPWQLFHTYAVTAFWNPAPQSIRLFQGHSWVHCYNAERIIISVNTICLTSQALWVSPLYHAI